MSRRLPRTPDTAAAAAAAAPTEDAAAEDSALQYVTRGRWVVRPGAPEGGRVLCVAVNETTALAFAGALNLIRDIAAGPEARHV